MKVIVSVKRVVNHNVKIRIKADQSGVDLTNVKMSMNPFDEIAVEEAIRLKEAGKASEIIAVSIGPIQAQETIRTALAMGADRGIHVINDIEIEPITIAKILKSIVEKINSTICFFGKQAIDDDCNQTGQMLSALLGWSQATFVSRIEINDNEVTVNREIDGGLETIKVNTPVVITTDLRLNEPRFVSLPNIIKAKKKTIDQIMLSDLGINLSSHLKTIKVVEPPERKSGIKVANVCELLSKLKNEAKVI
ncbi:electron transfer flavoprotein beta subunit [Candidatus Endolissoclinum faulkneri L5]|uniref:Electron transfer flavoprotein subunit beta n=1 Tax=Candidatus Endolissoclinum faulkneri L5 TaxID=1401328 RepID=V9TUJ3_9PROT|nr:electron transfer flavoprotein subunit beta/FixA family protein [Candidatus Endolissoclinum faulkneri]AHC73358.1 electron transfer flavoprotein beta subunit [Candidatus Endolissoclinum faulkneri L5]